MTSYPGHKKYHHPHPSNNSTVIKLVESLGKDTFSLTMSKSKDASSKLHEKHQLILADLLRDDGNKYCADCMVKGIAIVISV